MSPYIFMKYLPFKFLKPLCNNYKRKRSKATILVQVCSVVLPVRPGIMLLKWCKAFSKAIPGFPPRLHHLKVPSRLYKLRSIG